jgi:RNA polymerase sigma-70 factor (ECF subfamily)
VDLFNEIRDELVSTLLYILGNADDAHDAAQEAFLKCWRSRSSLPDVQNLRAWIFRIGLNAAKDYQRSAWKRKSRPLPEGDLMLPVRDESHGQSLEDKESLDRLREAISQLRPEEK